MNEHDHIDQTVCRICGVDPQCLYWRNKSGRLIEARFMAMHIRIRLGESREAVMKRYDRRRSALYHALLTLENWLQVDKKFRDKYEICLKLITSERTPYRSDLLRQGAKVWTREDSNGKVIEGRVESISQVDGYFIVGSFINPEFKTLNRIVDGRVTDEFETSADIVHIQT